MIPKKCDIYMVTDIERRKYYAMQKQSMHDGEGDGSNVDVKNAGFSS
jgi:hypothetical protein